MMNIASCNLDTLNSGLEGAKVDERHVMKESSWWRTSPKPSTSFICHLNKPQELLSLASILLTTTPPIFDRLWQILLAYVLFAHWLPITCLSWTYQSSYWWCNDYNFLPPLSCHMVSYFHYSFVISWAAYEALLTFLTHLLTHRLFIVLPEPLLSPDLSPDPFE